MLPTIPVMGPTKGLTFRGQKQPYSCRVMVTSGRGSDRTLPFVMMALRS